MPSSHAPTEPILYSFPTAEQVEEDLAKFILHAQFEAIAKRGKFTLALSGGSQPKLLRGLLKIDSKPVEWNKWHVYFADERVVPLDHPDSNYLACKSELFDNIPQIKTIHHIDNDLLKKLFQGTPPDKIDEAVAASFTEDQLEEVADEYESQLIAEFAQKDSARFPVFDLIMLGMGPDGHTGSLFPGHALLTEEERWIAYISDSPKPPPARITFTLPVINHAAKVAFVATGAGKQDILHQVLDRPEDGLPASRVRPKSPGGVYWFVDDAAAQKTVYPRTPFDAKKYQ